MRRFLHPALLGLLFLTACSLPWNWRSAQIIEATPPDLTVDNSYFENLGCFKSPHCLPESFDLIDIPIESLGPVEDHLGGLTPTTPLAVALNNSPYFLGEENFVYTKHCLLSRYTRYIVYSDGEYQLLSTRDHLASFYAPIETPEEAYSFAIAATGLRPLFEIAQETEVVFEQKVVEDSHVDAVEGGYVVHLYDTFICGCGPHYVDLVDVTVYTNGTLSIADPLPVYRNPALDDVCAD